MALQSENSSQVAQIRGVFTRAEIFQQPELWRTTLDIVAASQFTESVNNRPVLITGAGTSAYAASAIAASWPGGRAVPTTDLLVASQVQVEMWSPGFTNSGLLISLGRSGDSPESVSVVERVQRLCPNVQHLAITCNGKGRLATTQGVNSILLDPRTNDRSLAMTSSFSNLVLAGLCLQHKEEIKRSLPEVSSTMDSRLENLDRQAQQIAALPSDRVVVLASGDLQALATEASLKVTELTAGQSVTLTETFLGLRHGPMSFLREDTLVICFLSVSGHIRKYEEDLIRELREKRLGHLVCIGGHASNPSACEHVEAGAPQLPDYLRVPFEIPFAQLLAYHLSLKAGLDPDNPSPMGAITRVVQKFTIHDETVNAR